jgi:isoquinoline 1-oxidoreductase subunit beta
MKRPVPSSPSKYSQAMQGINRRNLLIGASVGGGLFIGWQLWPRKYNPNLIAGKGEHVFSSWLKIGEDGEVIVAIPQSEMGQGVYTQLAQIVAGELGADWRTVGIQPAMTNPLFANKLIAREWASSFVPPRLDPDGIDAVPMIDGIATRNTFMITAGSSSVRQFEDACRQAGATARILLCQAAAARWDTTWENCDTENGFVTFNKNRLAFAELVKEASKLTPPDPIALRASTDNTLSGQEMARVDVPAKLDGSMSFAGDIRLPDMLYASIRRGPIGDTKLKSFDAKGAAGVTGFIRAISTDEWLAALGSNWWAANRALDLMAPIFTTTGAMANSGTMNDILDSRLKKGEGWRIHNVGSVESTLEKSAGTRIFKSEYNVAAAVHAPLETRSATAHYKGGRLRLWIASQAPEAARAAAAEAIGISINDVVLFPMMAGGSFGRNLDSQIAAQVAILAQRTERPVQLIWSRPEDFMRDHYRAPAAAQITAAVNTANRIEGLWLRIATPSSGRELAARLSGDSETDAINAAGGVYDSSAVEGAIPPYAIPNLAIEHFPAKLPIPSGRWRGNSHSYTAFFIESFMDELAAMAGVEPLSYRMQMLVGQTRLARCLTQVAALAGWDGGADGSGKGIACHSMRGSHIALIATARTGSDGVKVERISAVVDCGRIINPEIARQQIEGGIVFGIAQALGSSTDFEGGLPLAQRLRDIDLPTLAEIPEIEIEFIRSTDAPGGIGEIGVPPVAPAIANALFSASKVRMRELPLLSKGL